MSTTVASAPVRRPPAEPRSGRRGRLRRRLAAVAVAVTVAALLGGSAWLVYGSSVFDAEQVTVRGNRELAAEQVIDAAAVPLGTPLARLDLDAIARRTTTLPPVEAATVTRSWPNGVVIVVSERRPLLGVRQPNSYIIVDKHGVAYESRPVLPKGAMLADVNPGDLPLLRDVGTVAAALPSGLAGKVSVIKATTRDNITLLLSSGVSVMWGTADDSTLKAEATRALLKRKPQQAIDVSSPHNPAYR